MSNGVALPIVADIGGRTVTRAEVLRYEDRRIDAAAKKIGVSAPSLSDVAHRRKALLHSKLELGTDEILRRLHRDDVLAGLISKATAAVTRRRRCSVTDLRVPYGSAERFVQCYWNSVHTNDEKALLVAHPDHFIQRIGADGRHEVLETTGGSPFAAHFFVDYDDTSTVVTPIDPAFPQQIAGAARVDGVAIGGVRHQFRNTSEGFHARLTVEFPLPTMGHMITMHRWHLAVEFSNWIEAAFTAE